jgi:hypothetical protein
MAWANEQIEWWRGRQKAYLEDNTAVERDKLINLQRQQAQQEMLQTLNSFLDGKLSLKEFNATFQKRTNERWGAFHLRGMSGGLFFNKLVKYVPNEDAFAHLMRLMIQAPKDRREAQQRMHAFIQFIEGLISSQQVQRAQLQPARVPFFLSIWWHIQTRERWPIFYGEVRHALMGKEPSGSLLLDPVELYFAFCTQFITLAQTLSISSWELEHLCTWSLRQSLHPDSAKSEKQHSDFTHVSKQTSSQRQTCMLTRRTKIKNKSGSNEKEMDCAVICRTHFQWLLAKIGCKVGCRVWIAASDHSKVCMNERLGDLSLPSLPILAESAFQKIISRIDVLWLQENEVVAAYEIEQACTDVSTSLLRLYDLGALFPNREVQLCVVAPRERFEKVQFELSRPTFRDHEISRRCALISEELLLQQEEHILRWASSPAVIEELICHSGIRE